MLASLPPLHPIIVSKQQLAHAQLFCFRLLHFINFGLPWILSTARILINKRSYVKVIHERNLVYSPVTGLVRMCAAETQKSIYFHLLLPGSWEVVSVRNFLPKKQHRDCFEAKLSPRIY